MRRVYPLLSAALLALLLAGCGSNASDSGTTDVPMATPESPSATVITPTDVPSNEPSPISSGVGSSDGGSKEPSENAETQLMNAAQEVVEYLRERDLKSLSETIDPELGLRFSPYYHINPESDLVFKPDELPAFKDSMKLKWGVFDGSGDPIELSFRDYFEKFVYSQDFAEAPEVNAGKIKATGNVKFNGTDVYPKASYVEFYFPGFDKKYKGQDWQSLVLMFVKSGSEWKLCAVVHGQWTI
ncbi:hypothetical protein [Cohnella kolymensis]|uniref:hypothetical protein n=1 Tax=Cohnella kolymensis TaxID=1590652 RepID=UPI00069894F7|nr:hypothetical protein [Cohnella kolymensis]